jgi:hypothetical protein
MTLSDSLGKAALAWEQTGVKTLPPASEREIRAVMQEIGRPVSADIIEMYQRTGGFAGGTDAHAWSLWSLDRIREINREYNRPLTAFSDGLIDSFHFCLRYEDELTSSVWIDHLMDTELVHVADSLTGFFDLYLSDPRAVGLI